MNFVAAWPRMMPPDRLMTGKNLQKVINLLPVAPQKGTMMQLGPLRHEVIGLRNENHNLRPLKGEVASLRASLADWFFALSEKEGKRL